MTQLFKDRRLFRGQRRFWPDILPEKTRARHLRLERESNPSRLCVNRLASDYLTDRLLSTLRKSQLVSFGKEKKNRKRKKGMKVLTSIAGPGTCLLMARMARTFPSPLTHCGLKQSVTLNGQS